MEQLCEGWIPEFAVRGLTALSEVEGRE